MLYIRLYLQDIRHDNIRNRKSEHLKKNVYSFLSGINILSDMAIQVYNIVNSEISLENQ